MHFRGKSFKATFKTKIQNGDGTLIHVPNYDFNWQHNYQFDQPIELDKIESIAAEVTFDNSDDNPFNPDPTQYVTWGDQTWEEMAVGFFDVSLPRKVDKKPETADTELAKEETESPDKDDAPTEAGKKLEGKVNEFVDDFFDRFDSDQNGLVTNDELPMSIRDWGLYKLQSDNKSGLTRDEIAIAARKKFRRNKK